MCLCVCVFERHATSLSRAAAVAGASRALNDCDNSRLSITFHLREPFLNLNFQTTTTTPDETKESCEMELIRARAAEFPARPFDARRAARIDAAALSLSQFFSCRASARLICIIMYISFSFSLSIRSRARKPGN